MDGRTDGKTDRQINKSKLIFPIPLETGDNKLSIIMLMQFLRFFMKFIQLFFTLKVRGHVCNIIPTWKRWHTKEAPYRQKQLQPRKFLSCQWLPDYLLRSAVNSLCCEFTRISLKHLLGEVTLEIGVMYSYIFMYSLILLLFSLISFTDTYQCFKSITRCR